MTSRAPLVVAVTCLAAAGADSAPHILTDTTYVEDVATRGGFLWVATRGGVERYDLVSEARRLFTIADGLAENAVRGLEDSGGIVARTDRARCRLSGERFACEAAPQLPAAFATPRLFRGVRVTAEVEAGGARYVGTAGGGLWRDGTPARRLTPDQQICGNHVMAVAEFKERTFIATFDDGLCSYDGASFRRAEVPFRMCNDLIATPRGLYVASTKGLWRSVDGERFDRVNLVGGRGVTDLAFDGEFLWATTPAALFRIRTRADQTSLSWNRPAGSRSLQAVDAAAGLVWIATEDGGGLRFKDGRFEAFDRAAGLPTSWAVDVSTTDDGGAYLATLRHGLVHVDGNGRAATVAGLPDAWLLHVSRGANGWWVGTQAGAAHVDRRGQVRTMRELPHPCVHVVAVTRHGLWAGTEGGTALWRGTEVARDLFQL